VDEPTENIYPNGAIQNWQPWENPQELIKMAGNITGRFTSLPFPG
jgi:hypothetical protein